jgi:uncharacterized protein (DUF4415 family)
MYQRRQLLHRDTIRPVPAISALHGEATIAPRRCDVRGAGSGNQEEMNMNKEYDPVWEQATAYRAEESAPSVKPAKPAAAGVKQIVTIRLDVDMLEWYKSAGPGYQTRINQILRDHMDAAKSH